MIARAASAPSLALSAAIAAGRPRRILSSDSETPITPVEATSTCSVGQPTSRAASAAIPRATSRPSSPVHAFAQPLFTITARAVCRERARCSRETTTGAACALLVVNTAAAAAGSFRHDEGEIDGAAGFDAGGHTGRLKAERCGDAAGPCLDRVDDHA